MLDISAFAQDNEVKIAMAQIFCLDGDRSGNFVRIENAVAEASKKGSELKTADTQFGRIGIMICADSFKDELLNQMKEENPDLVIIPYGWAKEENDWPEHGDALMKTVQQAAQKMECPVIGTDLVGMISNGPWRGLVYGGQSVASDKNGNILGKCKDRDRDLLIISLKL